MFFDALLRQTDVMVHEQHLEHLLTDAILCGVTQSLEPPVRATTPLLSHSHVLLNYSGLHCAMSAKHASSLTEVLDGTSPVKCAEKWDNSFDSVCETWCDMLECVCSFFVELVSAVKVKHSPVLYSLNYQLCIYTPLYPFSLCQQTYLHSFR